ncbi:MAG: efflux RND transporter periplasmic adaptor subunit [Chitinophagaceae bacterium]|nr:efflux RND transporter periplasmic adaptor subunit [Chitinophagaceae bacterium]
MKKYILLFLILTLAFAACGDKKEAKTTEAKEATTETDNDHENETTVEFTREQIKLIDIQIGELESKELTNTIKVNGMLTVPNQNKAYVTPVYNGVVQTLNVQPGSNVAKGQTIATIKNPELMKMQQEVQQLNEQIKLAELEVNRQKQLVEGNAAPLKRLQQAHTELATLRSQRSGLQKQLGGIGASQSYSSVIAVRAPISGTISKVIAQIGSNVDMASPIAEIVNNSQLHLDIFVYEKDLPKVKPGQIIHFTLTNNPGTEYDATIYSIGTAFEGDSKTVPVHARVTGNKYGLIDGMSVTALISLDRSVGAALPTEAIVSDKGLDYIFIVSGKENKADTHDHAGEGKDEIVTFEKIPVVKGVTDLGYTQITALKEIPPGSKIVIKNSFFILAKMNNTGEEGHAH